MADPKNSAPKQCTSLGNATHRTLALAFDLAGGTLTSSPQMFKTIVEDKEFHKVVAEALKKAGQQMMDEQAKGKPVSATDAASRLATAGGKAALTKGKSEAEKLIKKSGEYKRLEQSLKQLGCAFDQSKVGVFVNENKTLLIVVGAVGAIGGAVGLYYARTGDVVGENAAKLLSGMEIVKIGALKLTANKVEFKPSERKVTLELGAAGKWTDIQANFALGASFKNDQLAGANAQGHVVVDLNPRWSISADAKGAYSRGKPGTPDSASAVTALGTKYKLSEKANLSFQIIGSLSQDPSARKGSAGVGAKLDLAKPFGPKTSLSVGADAQRGVMQRAVPGGYGPQTPDNRVNFKVQLTF